MCCAANTPARAIKDKRKLPAAESQLDSSLPPKGQAARAALGHVSKPASALPNHIRHRAVGFDERQDVLGVGHDHVQHVRLVAVEHALESGA